MGVIDHEGTCRACSAPMLWATMPSGRLNPLNVEQVDAAVGKGVMAFNPKTGKGLPVTSAVIADCARWAGQGVTFHTSHFSDCPERKQFKRDAQPHSEASTAPANRSPEPPSALLPHPALRARVSAQGRAQLAGGDGRS